MWSECQTVDCPNDYCMANSDRASAQLQTIHRSHRGPEQTRYAHHAGRWGGGMPFPNKWFKHTTAAGKNSRTLSEPKKVCHGEKCEYSGKSWGKKNIPNAEKVSKKIHLEYHIFQFGAWDGPLEKWFAGGGHFLARRMFFLWPVDCARYFFKYNPLHDSF